MKIYARIQDGVVAELFETDGDITQTFHPSLIWVNVTENIPGIGWRQTPEGFDPPAPLETDPEEIEAHKVAIVQAHMDAAARACRYDNITNAITYADEPAVPKFQAEGLAFRAWRSLVWAKCYEILDEVNGGLRDIPTDEELISELPALVLPE